MNRTRWIEWERRTRRARLAQARGLAHEIRAAVAMGANHEEIWHLATMLQWYRDAAHRCGQALRQLEAQQQEAA